MDVDRRSILAAAGALPALTTLPGTLQAQPADTAQPSDPAGPPASERLVRFATDLCYEAIPADVVHAAKRLLLDSLGCALAGWELPKGRLAAGLMQQLGGEPKALVIGTRRRVSATNAAFANAELMNALDFDAIPHLPPVTIPAVLAVAEAEGLSGRQLILGLVIAYEIGARLSRASSQMQAALLETNTTPEIFGINDEAIMASAMGICAMQGRHAGMTAHALGLAGYYCPPQSSHDWETGSPKSNVKYTPVGWVAQGAVTAAMLAGTGFTANPIVLDGPAGFPKFYGWPKWQAARAVEGLGREWRILNPDFKPYAACRYIHSRLDCVVALVREHGIEPSRIERIVSLGPPFVANPNQHDVRTAEDAQFSIPYMLALAAMDIPIDARCQRPELLNDPRVRAMMAKIEWGTHPRTTETKRADPRSFIASADIFAGGARYAHEAWTASGAGAVPELRLGDDALQRKFLDCASTRLPADQAARLAQAIWSLDEARSIGPLMALLETG